MPPPLLLLTMGDAAGIGPEIICRAFAQGAAQGCVVVGDAAVLARAARLVQPLSVPVGLIERVADAPDLPPGCIPVLQPSGLPEGLSSLPWGRIDARCGAAAARCIDDAVRRVRGGEAAGLVTAPVHKEALAAAGVPFPGHTEMLQALAADGGDLPPVRMMLASDELRVVLVTIHVALRRAVDLISVERVLQTLRITHRWQNYQRGVPESSFRQTDADLGLHYVTKRIEDVGKFRTPSLRELRYTAPYMHNGAFASLREVVDFYDRGGGVAANKPGWMRPLGLSEAEKGDLIAFLDAMSMDQPLLVAVPELPVYSVPKGATRP